MWPNGWMIKIPLGMAVCLGPGHTVSWWTQLLQPKRWHSPRVSAHVCCGQTAGWIKMPLSREICLGPDDIVLIGTTSPTKRGTTPLFSGHFALERSSISTTAELLFGNRKAPVHMSLTKAACFFYKICMQHKKVPVRRTGA